LLPRREQLRRLLPVAAQVEVAAVVVVVVAVDKAQQQARRRLVVPQAGRPRYRHCPEHRLLLEPAREVEVVVGMALDNP
jgi:hypothetical protein